MQNNSAVLKEYLDILFRRKWWIVVPTVVGLILSAALYMRFDKLYRAQTRVMVRSQQISKALMQPTVELSTEQLVTEIGAAITSEQYMTMLNDSLKLVGSPGGPRDLSELAKVVDDRKELEINVRSRYFDLSIQWNDARMAAAIANELANIYIQLSKQIRSDIASEAASNLSERRAQIQAKLEEVRSKIQRLRSEHAFELQDYQPTNLQQIQSNEAEITRLDRELRDAESDIAEIDIQLQAPAAAAADAPRDPRYAELERAQSELGAMRDAGRTDEHPDVKTLLRRIAQLRSALGVEDGQGQASVTPAELQRQRLQQQRSARVLDRDAYKAQQERLRSENAAIRGRLQNTPIWQVELVKYETEEDQLARDFEEARTKENDALAGKQVEEYASGERLEVLNKARPSKDPFWPDLKLFLLMGLAVGGGLGASLVLLLEVFDQSFKSEEQLAASIDLPILAVIPDLNRAESLKRGTGTSDSSRRAGRKGAA